MASEACHGCKAPQCEWTMVRCSKGKSCRELFCFSCLSQSYPELYGTVFRRICWSCPACLGACHCEVCADPVKKQALQQLAFAKYKEEQDFIDTHKLEVRQAAALAAKEPKLVEPVIQKAQPTRDITEDPENTWPCPRCSVVNSAEEVECNACCFHRKRSTRKRAVYSEPAHYEDKHHAHKATPKRAREVVCYDENAPPQKGRVSALRQLVKKPWADGWDCARKLALDLVEEARQQAIKQDIPVSQVRQLPTKYQLANTRATHVRKWFDREPTLAKKFMRAAGFVKTKSNGTFLRQSIGSLDDLPELIRKADLSRYDAGTSLSGDEVDDIVSITTHLDSSLGSIESPSSPTSPSISCASREAPKLKVYYHLPNDKRPFVFKVPIADLTSIDQLQDRLAMLLREMGQSVDDVVKKPFVVTGEGPTHNRGYNYLSELLPCATMDDLSRCSLIHVRAQ